MRSIKDFLTSSRAAMIDYIFVVSSPGPGARGSLSTLAFDERLNRLRVIDSLNHRSATMPLLYREAIPVLPYLLDVPRHLAVISSAVIRRSVAYRGTLKSDSSEAIDLEEFCEKCYVIEEHALRRVNQLGSLVLQAPSRKKRPSNTSVGGRSSTTSIRSNPLPSHTRSTQSGKEKESPVTSLVSLTSRPSTAPTPSDRRSEQPPAPPMPQAEDLTASSRTDAPSLESPPKSPNTLCAESSLPATDVSSLRRVQTCESMRLPPSDATHKRKGFFRSFLSRK